MLTCLDAMVLSDKAGKIIHCNREYADLTGYTLRDIEGHDSSTLLSGSMTDFTEMRRCSGLNKLNINSSMCVVNYRKDGSMFANLITTVPIFGSYSTHGKIQSFFYLRSLRYLILSYIILSYLILSYLILSYLILSYLILSYHILSYLIISYLILSYLILSYLILSNFISSYIISSNLI